MAQSWQPRVITIFFYGIIGTMPSPPKHEDEHHDPKTPKKTLSDIPILCDGIIKCIVYVCNTYKITYVHIGES